MRLEKRGEWEVDTETDPIVLVEYVDLDTGKTFFVTKFPLSSVLFNQYISTEDEKETWSKNNIGDFEYSFESLAEASTVRFVLNEDTLLNIEKAAKEELESNVSVLTNEVFEALMRTGKTVVSSVSDMHFDFSLPLVQRDAKADFSGLASFPFPVALIVKE